MASGKWFRRKSSKQLREKSNKAQSKEIDKALWEDKKRQAREVKLLLLGAGDSGKSTIVKQMKIIHNGGFDDMERRQWKNTIFHNLVDSFVDILAIVKSEGIELQHDLDQVMQYTSLLSNPKDLESFQALPEEYLDCFQSLLEDTGIQMAMLRGQRWAMHDNLNYFLEDLDRLCQPDYLPTNEDILRAKLRTTGVHETSFHLAQAGSQAITYRMVDVGGQRSERKKWIHAFDNVNAVLFVAALSAYDQVLAEDITTNQMDETLMLFDEICNSPVFKHAAFILFLNKMDLLTERIAGGLSPISRYDLSYTGDPTDVRAAQDYFTNRILRLQRKYKERPVYTHFTTATNTDLLNRTMNIVQKTVLKHNLEILIL